MYLRLKINYLHSEKFTKSGYFGDDPRMNMKAIARTQALKTMRPAVCVLRPATKYAASGSTQTAARRPQAAWFFTPAYAQPRSCSYFYEHASEIAGNFIAPLMERQGKLKYVQIGAACDLRPAAKYEPTLRMDLQLLNPYTDPYTACINIK